MQQQICATNVDPFDKVPALLDFWISVAGRRVTLAPH
jgi:hypothetical protein